MKYRQTNTYNLRDLNLSHYEPLLQEDPSIQHYPMTPPGVASDGTGRGVWYRIPEGNKFYKLLGYAGAGFVRG